MTGTEDLTRALVVLAAAGGRPPCGEYGGHDLWFSDDPDEWQLAIDRCHVCPVLVACGAAADEQDERWGVWAGVRRTSTPSRSKKAA